MSDKRDKAGHAAHHAPQPPGISSAALDLARETGITEAEAEDLIRLIGNNHASLLREARILKKRS
jgi:hypothetical protein